MGRKTYEQILEFGNWPYRGKPSYIFTRKPAITLNKEIEFISDDIQGFIHQLETQNIQKLWIVGGAELIKAFYVHGRIDEFIVTIFPNVLRRGILLEILSNAIERDELIKLETIDFGDGVVQDHYFGKMK